MGAAGAAVTAVGSWLECRDQMVFAIADEIGTTHAFEGFAQQGPVVGIVIAQERLVQTAPPLTFGSIHLFATLIAVVLTYVLTTDLTTTIIVAVGCTAVQFIIGNILDPWLLGQTLRLSSFGIILSLAFWGAIWGIPGMFLAVPIMVAVMIVCAHIPWLRPVAVMLSREGHPDDGLAD